MFGNVTRNRCVSGILREPKGGATANRCDAVLSGSNNHRVSRPRVHRQGWSEVRPAGELYVQANDSRTLWIPNGHFAGQQVVRQFRRTVPRAITVEHLPILPQPKASVSQIVLLRLPIKVNHFICVIFICRLFKIIGESQLKNIRDPEKKGK